MALQAAESTQGSHLLFSFWSGCLYKERSSSAPSFYKERCSNDPNRISGDDRRLNYGSCREHQGLRDALIPFARFTAVDDTGHYICGTRESVLSALRLWKAAQELEPTP